MNCEHELLDNMCPFLFDILILGLPHAQHPRAMWLDGGMYYSKAGRVFIRSDQHKIITKKDPPGAFSF